MESLFCGNCDNMLVTKIQFNEDESSSLVRHCRNCNNSIDEPEKTQSVYHRNYNLEMIKREHIVNKYTSFDNTLPKAQGIKCPNANCPKSKKSDIRYIKYDDNDMKYIYICLDCSRANIEPNTW